MDTSNVQPGNGSTSGIERKESVGLAVEHAPAVSMLPAQLAGFDQHHPPDRELVADCVHCGFCLPTCPTYLLWGEEMDSPRGRILLMDKQIVSQDPLTDTVAEHFDRCLGCMACVTACPSGVQYDKLIELTRERVEEEFDRSPRERLVRETVFRTPPYRRRMRAALAAAPVGKRVPGGPLPPPVDPPPPTPAGS